jgi:hypothetical protein
MTEDRPTTEFEMGRLRGTVTALESRVDKLEGVLSTIDSKLDSVLLALAQAVGGRDRVTSLIRWGFATSAMLASVVGTAIASLHFLHAG